MYDLAIGFLDVEATSRVSMCKTHSTGDRPIEKGELLYDSSYRESRRHETSLRASSQSALLSGEQAAIWLILLQEKGRFILSMKNQQA